MANCCGATRCNCRVTAGPGVTVDGNGAPDTPYVISADGAALETADSNCIALTGDGTTGAPLTATPVIDPAPGNALSCGPDGLLVTPGAVSCDDVRPCLSAGDGIAYDNTTGIISARPSTDAGNTLGFGTDGGLLVPAPADTTALEAADTTTVDSTVSGTGSVGDPFVVSAAVILDAAPPGGGTNLINSGPDGLYLECEQVRGCLTAGAGITYDDTTGTIAADDTVVQAGTGVTVTGTGSPADPYEVSAVPPETGCGLTGDGSTGTPLAASVAAWPYPCDIDAQAGGVYCDSNGELRSEPRGSITYVQDQQVLDVADVAVPAALDTEVATHTLNVVNPDPCRPAFVIMEGEVDADFNLPAGAGAALGIATDEMSYLRNSGTTAILDTHIQGTKVVPGIPGGGTIPPGGSVPFTLSIRMGRGSGGATYNRVQSFLRAYIIVL
ncbi:hypothetical protein ACFY64_32035 [Streptomyces collinus]|uniref:hypothetical protein n=1 Tax=Streptomyces collinus TaxID=42684 RepID=UPI00369DB775